MKNYTNWLLVAILFLCQKSTAQGYISLKDRAKQIEEEEQKQVVPRNTQQVNNSILSDTFKNVEYVPFQNLAKKKESESTVKNAIKETLEEWEKIVLGDQKKTIYNAFAIDTVVYFDKPKPVEHTSPKLTSKTVFVNSSPEAFNMQGKEMTVKFDSVKNTFIAVNEGKQAAKIFGIDYDTDQPDSIVFNNGKGILWKGEYFTKINDDDLERHFEKPKREKKKRELIHVRMTERVPPTVDEFLDEYEDDIRTTANEAGIPFAIKCGQILTEASIGSKMSKLAQKENNLGGIKCGGGRCNLGDGHHGYYKDDEENETFKRYATPTEFLKAHNKFLQENDRYNRCFECGNDVDCWLLRLQQSGYATHRHYDYLIASVINRYRLTDRPLRYNRSQTAKRLNIKF